MAHYSHYREYVRDPEPYRAVREKVVTRTDPYRDYREDRYQNTSRQNGGPQGPYVVPMDGIPNEKRPPKWSWGSMILSLVALFLCCGGSCCSIFGVLCSSLSYTDHKAKDFERSASKKKWAWGCAIAGLILGILVVIGVGAGIGVGIAAGAAFLSNIFNNLPGSA